jgi:hypothetical protein
LATLYTNFFTFLRPPQTRHKKQLLSSLWGAASQDPHFSIQWSIHPFFSIGFVFYDPGKHAVASRRTADKKEWVEVIMRPFSISVQYTLFLYIVFVS